MPFQLDSFLHYVFIGFIALFPVVNPLGTAFIVSPYLTKLSKTDRINAVKKITLYTFLLCLITLLTGHWILILFGISIPIIQLAGGIMICKIGWDFLTPKPSQSNNENLENDQEIDIDSKLFYPITFPITAGAGVISVLITLSAHGSNGDIKNYFFNMGSILISVIGLCFLVFICYTNSAKLINYMGSQREKIVNSIMAFLIFCVGLQIAVGGITQLIK